MSAYFITSTGTGVGKTFTTCALLHAARMQGKSARGLKPMISGWDENDPESDVRQIVEAGGNPLSHDAISLHRFTAPLSPHRAAVLENKRVDVTALEEWCRRQMQGDTLSLIEGAGGVMTPITERYTMLDLMAALQLPVILVVGSYLGTISHTLTALEVLHARGLTVKALVLCESADSTVSLTETRAGLSTFISDIPLQVVQARVSSWREAKEIHAFAEAL